MAIIFKIIPIVTIFSTRWIKASRAVTLRVILTLKKRNAIIYYHTKIKSYFLEVNLLKTAIIQPNTNAMDPIDVSKRLAKQL